MAATPMKFNPAFLSDDELVAGFAIREHELGQILDIVRDNDRASNQHVLVIGPRGYGKTTLLLRLAAATRSDASLRARWYPIVFSEEVEVASPGELWAEAVFFLGKQTEDPRWRTAYETIRRETDEERLRVLALAELRTFAEREGKRLLLMVENLQVLFTEQLSANDAWTIRHTLQSEPWLMLLTTATARFDAIEDPNQALYELFHVVELAPLSARECAHLFGRVGPTQIDPLRGRALQILTGGNPRLLVVLARFAQGAPLHSLVDDFARLIDDHSDYFKSNIDALPALERRVFTALAELWAPATAREVADVTRLDANKVSAVLARLEQRGIVAVQPSSPRRKRYQVSERLYNLYWLMRRHGRTSERVRFVIDFIAAYYDVEALATTCLDFADRALALQPTTRPIYVYSFLQLLDRLATTERSHVVLRLSAQFLALPELPETTRDRLQTERANLLTGAEDFVARVATFVRARPLLAQFASRVLADDDVRRHWTPLVDGLRASAPPNSYSQHWPLLYHAFKSYWQRDRGALIDLVGLARRTPDMGLSEIAAAAALALALDDDRALRFARLLVERYPGRPWPRLILLVIKYVLGDMSDGDAVKHGGRLCDRYPASFTVPFALGVLFAVHGADQPSRLFFTRALSAEAVLRLADAMIDIRDDIMEYEQDIILQPKWRAFVSLTEDPTWEHAFAFLSRFARIVHGEDCSGDVLQRSTVALPNSCHLHLLLGMSAFTRQDASGGAAALARAAELRCESWQTLLAVGSYLAISGSTDRARELVVRSWHLYAPAAPDAPLRQQVAAWFIGAAKHVPELPILDLLVLLVQSDPVHALTVILANFEPPAGQIPLIAACAACVPTGQIAQALELIHASPRANRLEPLILALSRYSGDDTPAPAELEAVASDLLRQFHLVEDIVGLIRRGTSAS